MIDSTASISAMTPITSGAYSRGLSLSGATPASQPVAASSTISTAAPNQTVTTAQSQAAAKPQSAAQPPTLEQALEAFRQHFGAQQPALVFRIDQDKGDVFVSVVDSRDDKVISQIPDADARRIARDLSRSQATLLERKA
jgi:uncharacterized FlaG/YvyC family protein